MVYLDGAQCGLGLHRETHELPWRLDAARIDTAPTSWCPFCAAARARLRQPAQRSNRAKQYHDIQWMRLNLPSKSAGAAAAALVPAGTNAADMISNAA